MKRKDIIMGIAINYSIEDLQPFILSLKRSGYQGKVVLFVEDKRSLLALYLQSLSVETLICGPSLMPYGNSRYFLYKEFLKKEKQIERVLITDVRDVFFQSDPMISFPGHTLFCFEEDRSMSLSSCPYNSKWVLETYGEAALSRFGNSNIICSGVTVGSHELMIDYLEKMCNELERVPSVWGGDQAVHNMLFYSGKIPYSVLIPNESASVYTLAYVPPELLRTDANGAIINSMGIPAVIHQYDRHPLIAQKIKDRFATKPLLSGLEQKRSRLLLRDRIVRRLGWN
jgi:hypothetical protein